MNRALILVALVITAGVVLVRGAEAEDRPNVILIMTDDQGYGDFGATGNEVIQTPHIDRMASQSASMTTFYVSPVCSPTRACLMTGRYNYRTRVVDTWIGRSMMDPNEITIAEVLGKHGYATGIFGKWHLGDCYPLRAIDQGFDEALIHFGGGLAQPSEPRENNRRYTDAILFKNGVPVQTKGYCTDVYFDASLDFIKQQRDSNNPFFVYLPTNAPHGPFHDVPLDWLQRYQEQSEKLRTLIRSNVPEARVEAEVDKLARISAMISNVDDNVGKLMGKLKEWELLEDTVVIFMVDNGPNSVRYVGPFRGSKTGVHEGGIRSPLWIHAPGRLEAGASRNEPSAHIDIMPTILELCGIPDSDAAQCDGKSFWSLLKNGKGAEKFEERSLVIQTHRGDVPQQYHHFMIRNGKWKLLHASGFGKESFKGEPKLELYDVVNDPGESENLVDKHADVVSELKRKYENWFEDVSTTRPDNYAPPRILVGTENEEIARLTRQDWRNGSWASKAMGHWELAAPRAFRAKIVVEFDPSNQPEVLEVMLGGKALRQEIEPKQDRCEFPNVAVAAGEMRLESRLSRGDEQRGVYQVSIERIEDE